MSVKGGENSETVRLAVIWNVVMLHVSEVVCWRSKSGNAKTAELARASVAAAAAAKNNFIVSEECWIEDRGEDVLDLLEMGLL